jgi:hypothetical protein
MKGKKKKWFLFSELKKGQCMLAQLYFSINKRKGERGKKRVCGFRGGGVAHYGLAIYIKKYGKALQKKNYENSNISPRKNIIFKKSSRRNQNPSRYYNSITNLKFQHKPKKTIFQKSLYKNRPIIYYLVGAKIP